MEMEFTSTTKDYSLVLNEKYLKNESKRNEFLIPKIKSIIDPNLLKSKKTAENFSSTKLVFKLLINQTFFPTQCLPYNYDACSTIILYSMSCAEANPKRRPPSRSGKGLCILVWKLFGASAKEHKNTPSSGIGCVAKWVPFYIVSLTPL